MTGDYTNPVLMSYHLDSTPRPAWRGLHNGRPMADEPSTHAHEGEVEMQEIIRGEYREAARAFLYTINRAVQTIAEARDARVAAWQVAISLGLPMVQGRTIEQIAQHLGVKRATLSKGAKKFQRGNNLPPSEYAKPSHATKSYSRARKNHVTQ